MTTVRMPVEGELLNKQTRQLLALKAETFLRIALKEREFSTGEARVDVQLVLCRETPACPIPVRLWHRDKTVTYLEEAWLHVCCCVPRVAI